MPFLLAFEICLCKKFLFQPSSSEGFCWKEVSGDMIFANISFRYLLLLHGSPEHSMNKAVLSSKCIHSFNKFLKIMEQLLSNREIIHALGSLQIQKANGVLGTGINVSGTPLNRTKKQQTLPQVLQTAASYLPSF